MSTWFDLAFQQVVLHSPAVSHPSIHVSTLQPHITYSSSGALSHKSSQTSLSSKFRGEHSQMPVSDQAGIPFLKHGRDSVRMQGSELQSARGWSLCLHSGYNQRHREWMHPCAMYAHGASLMSLMSSASCHVIRGITVSTSLWGFSRQDDVFWSFLDNFCLKLLDLRVIQGLGW